MAENNNEQFEGFDDQHIQNGNNDIRQDEADNVPGQNNGNTINAIAGNRVKIPPFWEQNPSIWFARVEAQFKLSNIRSETTKFDYLIGQIDSKVLQQVSEIVINPPTVEPYTKLKAKILERFGESEQRRFQRLLSQAEMGDKKPSQVLNEMRSMSRGAGNDMLVNDKMLRTIWIQRLPTNVRGILSLSDEATPLENLATMADKIFETTEPIQVSEISYQSKNRTQSPTKIQSPEVKELYSQINAIVKKLDDLRTDHSQTRGRSENRNEHRNENRNRNRSKSRPKYQVPEDANPKHCWYHQLMGDKAKNCREPCTYQKNQ